jgi:hypothetical protein
VSNPRKISCVYLDVGQALVLYSAGFGVVRCRLLSHQNLLGTFFYSSPEGKKFRSRKELKAFLLGNDLLLNADDFDFSVSGKGVRAEGRIAPLY